MTVAVLGLFVVGITAALLVSQRGKSAQRQPLDAAVAEQQVAFWLPTDMQSLGSASTDIVVETARGTRDCSGRLAGLRVLHLGWTEGAKPDRQHARLHSGSAVTPAHLLDRRSPGVAGGRLDIEHRSITTERAGHPLRVLAHDHEIHRA